MPSIQRTLFPVLMSAAMLSACSQGGSSAEASCAQPHTTVSPAQAQPGQSIQVTAEVQWSDCPDQGDNNHGHALQDQAVTWRESGSSTELARVDADPDTGQAQSTVQIPAAATPGTAEIRIGNSAVATITVIAPPHP